MMMTHSIVMSVLALLFAAACGGDARSTPDSRIAMGDAPVGGAITIPPWQLEDVQPQSPLVNQTYGLDTFAGKIVVVVLLEGF